MNEHSALDGDSVPGLDAPAGKGAESPRAGYSGRPRDTQLEYKAILANVSIGIAFTRDRRFTLCNPKFAEMFGWKPDELIGQSGDIVYPSRESYEALGQIAIPVLAAGRQLDVAVVEQRVVGGLVVSSFAVSLRRSAIVFGSVLAIVQTDYGGVS